MSGKDKDYVKAILEFYKVMITALLGLLFIMFWYIMTNPNNVQSMDNKNRYIILIILLFLIILLLGVIFRYWRLAEDLKD